jgi:hypothetical protein
MEDNEGLGCMCLLGRGPGLITIESDEWAAQSGGLRPLNSQELYAALAKAHARVIEEEVCRS